MSKLKKLMEKRAELAAKMENMIATAGTENRALSEEERAAFDGLEAEIKELDETLNRELRASRLAMTSGDPAQNTATAEVEERAFADYIRGAVTELRAGEQNLGISTNGAVIPTTISNRIIKAVKDRCPILAGASMYAVNGTVKVPVWGNANTTHNIKVAYGSEFSSILADSGKFTSVDLGGYLVDALCLVGIQAAENGAFDIVTFVVDAMAEDIATFVETEMLVGTGSNALQGATNTTNTVTAADTTAVTADELIELQSKVKQAYQKNACWTMNPATFTAVKKLKDSQNRYLLQDNVAGEFPYMLLGKPVYVSDGMPAMAASATAILYGDYSGMSVNIRQQLSVRVLRERFADQNAIGVIGVMEIDAKITDHQKLACLVMHA